MYREECEELIQTEAERFSEILLGSSYYNLDSELRLWMRAHAIESLWPQEMEGFIAAA